MVFRQHCSCSISREVSKWVMEFPVTNYFSWSSPAMYIRSEECQLFSFDFPHFTPLILSLSSKLSYSNNKHTYDWLMGSHAYMSHVRCAIRDNKFNYCRPSSGNSIKRTQGTRRFSTEFLLLRKIRKGLQHINLILRSQWNL